MESPMTAAGRVKVVLLESLEKFAPSDVVL